MSYFQKLPQWFHSLLGITAIVFWVCMGFFESDSWLESNQVFFHLPLVVIVWSMFSKRLTLLMLGLLCWVSYSICRFGLIDEHLYEWLSKNHLFPSSAETAFSNPQYAKLILYAVFLGLLFVILLFKKQRSVERIFVFVSGCACLMVTYLIHDALPSKTLRWERQLSQQSMLSSVNYLKKNPETNFENFCQSFNFSCFQANTFSDVQDELNKNVWSKIKSNMDQMQNSVSSGQVFEAGYFSEERWFRQMYGVVKSNRRYLILIEEENINKSQVLTEEAFGKVATYATFAWGFLFILLGIFHTSPIRKKVFPKQD